MRKRRRIAAPSRRELLRAERGYGPIEGSAAGDFRIGLAFPNTYSVGIANLGFQTILRQLRGFPEFSVERLFLTNPGGEAALRTFESDLPAGGLDVLAFSVSFENDYANLVAMLNSARIPVRREERDERHPIIVVGGAITFLNPEPLRAIADIFLLGEGEEMGPELMTALRRHRDLGRAERIDRATEVSGAYVPAIHESCSQINPRSYPQMKEAPAHSSIVTPHSEFRDTMLLEVSRGCPRRCRFCTVGSAFPKFRMLPARKAVEMAERFREEDHRLQRTPITKIGLVTAAFFDHVEAEQMAAELHRRGFEIGASSVRVDQLTSGVLEILRASGLRSITVAPEAGTERLRRIIRKDASEAAILDGVEKIAKAGFRSIRIYYMVGLPFETDADREGLVREAMRIRTHFYDKLSGAGNVTVSLHPFVPKPRTPFQWAPMIRPHEMKKIVSDVRRSLPGIRVKCPSQAQVYTEGILARGGEELTPFVEKIAAGEPWLRAARSSGIDLEEHLHKPRDPDSRDCWDGPQSADRVRRVNQNEFDRAGRDSDGTDRGAT